MKRLAIIPARGGSKRIPRKNIKDFCGKPILAYSIEAALQTKMFDEVMVSTDDEEIAKIGEKYGAKIPFLRSPETASDYATTKDVLLEVLGKYKDMGKIFETMFCIYPSTPFVSSISLINAINEMEDSDCSEIFPVVPFSYPPQRSYIVENGFLKTKYPEFALSRSQDLEKLYHDAGQFYGYNTSDYLLNNGVIKEKIKPIILSELEVQDIDNETDWIIAEMKYKMLNR